MEPEATDVQLPVIECGAQVCGMHPEHTHVHEGRMARCPGSMG